MACVFNVERAGTGEACLASGATSPSSSSSVEKQVMHIILLERALEVPLT